MFCVKCGKELKEGEKFCRSCGAPVKQKQKEKEDKEIKVKAEKPVKKAKEVVKEKVVEETVPEVKPEPVQVEPVQPEKQKKSGKGVLIGILVALFVVVIGAVVVYVMFLSGKNIDALGNTELKFDGYNGIGNVIVIQDGEEAEDPNEALREYIEEMSEDAHSLIPFADPIVNIIKGGSSTRNFERALESLTYTFEVKGDDKKVDEIANGDIVIVRVDCNEEALKSAGYRLTNTSKEFTVDGLSDADQLDPFEYINLIWKTSSKGDFTIVAEIKDDCPVKEFSCEVSEIDDNGDVEVTVDKDDFASSGYKVKKDKKTMHVGEAPKRLDKLTDENNEAVRKLALSTLKDVYISKCGYNLYVGDKQELIDAPTVDNITSISANYGVVFVEFDITTKEGANHYKKSFNFDCYIDSEGNPINTTDIDKDSLSCSITGKTWYEH